MRDAHEQCNAWQVVDVMPLARSPEPLAANKNHTAISSRGVESLDILFREYTGFKQEPRGATLLVVLFNISQARLVGIDNAFLGVNRTVALRHR